MGLFRQGKICITVKQNFIALIKLIVVILESGKKCLIAELISFYHSLNSQHSFLSMTWKEKETLTKLIFRAAVSKSNYFGCLLGPLEHRIL